MRRIVGMIVAVLFACAGAYAQTKNYLQQPSNLRDTVEYNDSLNIYYLGTKLGSSYLTVPQLMTPQEYQQWVAKKSLREFFKKKNSENTQNGGKDKFELMDMHFDLGPAEKIFGPGGVRIKTQGTAELKVGGNIKKIDNPSLPIRNRKTTAFDFDEKVNLNLNGKVGDKVNMNLNYNTDATFDFDAQNLKLKYEGKEDEIIKLVEAGNISFPSNNSLVKGASSLFGVRTDMQFGRLKLQTVLSQKKSSSKSVSSRGGTQTTAFELGVADYEENRHFFLSHYFRNHYDQAMSSLPNLTTGVEITRVEIWVTNKTGSTSNTRNIVAVANLGENGTRVPDNNADGLYPVLTTQYAAARDIDQTNSVLAGVLESGSDYEKLSSARLLTASEYMVNKALGYISLRSGLQTDQVLAVAFEFTSGGVTYKVGEFAADVTETSKALFVKSLKNTSNNPAQPNWKLMMKNVYYLASQVEKSKFRLDIKYQSDTAGVYLTYIPDQHVKNTTLLKMLGCDRLDNNNKLHANGYFDFVEGYTVSDGRVFLPSVEPFGDYLRKQLISGGVPASDAEKYVFSELYDSTKTVAKLIAEKDKYMLVGQYKGSSANVISLGAMNVPHGSVVVTAGGMVLREGTDYSVDYSAGEVTILNQSIIDAGTNVNVSLESDTDYGMQRKTMLGVNWEYELSKSLTIGGTLMHLSEQALTSKVAMGEEPLSNTIWGLNVNWKQESQWLTSMLNKIPFLHVKQPSHISFTGEFAQLIAGRARGTQDNASYVDDFENTKSYLDMSNPKEWTLSSVPSMFVESGDKTGVSSGYNRALLAWYNVDPIFTRRSSTLTPAHIKSDLEQLSNHYVREVYVKELYPNRDQSTYNGATSTLPILNLAYYPEERGPYNLSLSLNSDGTLQQPATKWGGMMRKIDTNDFEQANIEYIEFWLLDPFIYTREKGTASEYAGDLYFNLGEVSEDILRDGKKFYESGMPVDGSENYTTTQWGKIPVQASQTYAFATTTGSRRKQDTGYNGLTDEEEQQYGAYREWLDAVGGVVTNDSTLRAWRSDPAGDDYHYFRGSDFDNERKSILERYKHINNPQGNSPETEDQTESYDTSYKSGPDVEDINQDYTLNEYERYYQYKVRISPEILEAYRNGAPPADCFITDMRTSSVKLRNGDTTSVNWYQFRIPLNEYERKVGAISDFTSVRFMRMFMTGFQKPIVLRFGSLDLVRGEWRVYKQSLGTGADGGVLEVSAVNIEENNDKTPVNYVLPPGISRVTDPSQPQLVENNEQALDMVVKDLQRGESKAVYRNMNLDLRQYKHMQMFVHANHLVPDATQLRDGDLAVFVRLGSDYKNNYYEYEIPLSLTPDRSDYSKYATADRRMVWPEENMLDVNLDVFTSLKKKRNQAKAQGVGSFNQLYTDADPHRPANKVKIVGNPTLGEVKVMMIGVRNASDEVKSGEVWVNELRLMDANNNGGWAASGNMNVQLSDFGTVNLSGRYISDGFGGLEENVMQRSTDTQKEYAFTAQLELGKFFPDKAKVSAPLYYSVSHEEVRPRYNPLDSDMRLDDALEGATRHERDSIESIAVTKTRNTNFALTNLRWGLKTKRHPMPYDPANFSFSYSHSHRNTSGKTTVYEKEDQWRGALNYTYSPVYQTWEPFKKLKGKSKWLNFPRALGLNYLPQNISFNTEMTRNYYELQERDLESLENQNLPLTFSEQFLWNRDFSLRWDFTKNLHFTFQSATRAEIEEPYTPINKDLYPDQYVAWKDSVKQSIRNWGTPLDYQQQVTVSYQLPLNKLPIFDWVNADASYTGHYTWVRGTELEDGTSLGNTITSNRQLNINCALNLVTLYNHVPFLQKANRRNKGVVRVLMMLRSVNISYRNQYAMLLPGFMPNVGDMLGQNKSGSTLAPGLDFAFGLMGDGYIDKALSRNWLLQADSVSTPANINQTKDLQIKALLEPVRDLKIDLSASRTDNRAKSVQYMYAGMPTTLSGTFNMTVISLRGALAGMGNANNGYRSAAFEHFRELIPEFQQRVGEAYSAEVLIPAFLSAYTSGAGKSLAIFPSLVRLLPNWTIRYGGLSKLAWVKEHLKSLNLNHAYKSVYSVGSYVNTSYSTVSINESFSPLLGVDATFQNDLTAKVEYRTTRMLNLSMTSVQLNESLSKDWVVGLAYKIRDFNLFGPKGNRTVAKAQSSRSGNPSSSSNSSRTSNPSLSRKPSRTGVNHDLNLRLDVSLRKQAAITRDIATGMSSASSGNSAFKLSFMADYTLSRLLTLTAYYDMQTNTPLLSSNSYPTTTYDFGLSMKFSLTR